MDLRQVAGQPDGGLGTLTEFSDDLVLAMVENIAKMDGIVSAQDISLKPLIGRDYEFESPLAVVQAPGWHGGGGEVFISACPRLE